MKLLLLALALAVAATGVDAQQSPDAIVAKLDAYLASYEPRLSELIADEAMTQQMSREALAVARRAVPGQVLRRFRRLRSEVAFIALPNDAGWLGFRHVKTVDGATVKAASESLMAALQKAGFESANALLKDSAAQNLGLPRTTNLPNLPLEFLHRRNRARLVARIDGTERIRNSEVVRLVFGERATSTLIRNPNGDDMPSVVRTWVSPETGALMRAEVMTYASSKARDFESRIRVDFAPDRTLGMFVPIEMREQFPMTTEHHGTSVAIYSNFRRFQTSARIVTPPGQP